MSDTQNFNYLGLEHKQCKNNYIKHEDNTSSVDLSSSSSICDEGERSDIVPPPNEDLNCATYKDGSEFCEEEIGLETKIIRN